MVRKRLSPDIMVNRKHQTHLVARNKNLPMEGAWFGTKSYRYLRITQNTSTCGNVPHIGKPIRSIKPNLRMRHVAGDRPVFYHWAISPGGYQASSLWDYSHRRP